jgi:hypothetical protein
MDCVPNKQCICLLSINDEAAAVNCICTLAHAGRSLHLEE